MKANETHQQGNPRIVIFQVPPVTSCSIYCGDSLKGQVHGEDSLQTSVSTMGLGLSIETYHGSTHESA